ncbi:hypothetical protein ABFV83_09850 [Lacrimispora sp. BS-2]|uniref:Lipoprotein n=1 Tax=Lacrimispora sp. BS-2 TaxID=3151850 RepID=A0AAU7PV31_9FIRM
MQKKISKAVVIGICMAAFVLIALSYIRKSEVKHLRPGTVKYNINNMAVNKTLKNNFDDFALVGYDNELIYTFQSKDDGIEYYVNNGNFSNMVYKSNASAVFCNQLYSRDMIIGEFYAEEPMSYAIRRVNKDTEEILMQGECKGIPIVNVIGENLVVNSHAYKGGKVEQTLQLYNFINNEIMTIGNYVYEIDMEGKCTGELLQAVDGFDNSIVFELIYFDNENMDLDETGKPTLFRYDLKENNLIKLPITPPRKLLYVAGDEQCIITSDYASARPLSDVGTIYVLRNGEYISMGIPEIESGNDIVDAGRITESTIIIQTLNNVYMIDYEKGIYEKINNSNPIKINEESFGFIDKNNSLNIYEFNN